MKFKVLTLSILLTATFSTFTQAALIDFDFSFASDQSGTGNVPGIVTGEIIGLKDNATSAPTEIIVTSAPLSFSNLGFTTPIDFPVHTALTAVGGFTVSNGIIESGGFSIDTFYQGSNGSNLTDSNITLNGPQNLSENFLREGSANITGNHEGFGGVTYTPVAAPEPSGIALSLVCVAAFIVVRRSFNRDRSA